ncbi:hypothetical protein [Chryseobacterium sp. GP-SGM7]|uniref:hypothetical protein n=1 Tax=Chryseobacterium sp. GP-SGM7 TaxID=3411323 RepID=UPI003B958275
MKILYILFLFQLFSCNENKPKHSLNQNTTITEKQIQEYKVLNFRRTYVGHENLPEKELKKLHESNPTLLVQEDSEILRKLNELKILEDNNLLVSKFDNKKLNKAYLDHENVIEITCKYDSLNYSEIKLSIQNGTKKALKTLDFKGDHIVGIILKDIDNDNVKEILILRYYYIMNGDNFDLWVLKYQ